MTADDIIQEILFYLPNWGLEEEDDEEQVKVYTEGHDHHSHRKHYGPPSKPINPFVTDQEQTKEVRQYKVRNKVKRGEVLHAHHLAIGQALQYMGRCNIPETSVCHDAVCMWAAGLLEKKYRFKLVDGEDNEHPLNLIRDAKSLLDPYILPYFRVIKPPKNTPPHHGMHHYPPPYYDDPFFREWHQGPHHYWPEPKPTRYWQDRPRCHKPRTHIRPVYDDGWLKAYLEVEPVYGKLGDTITLTARVYDIWGNPMNSGTVTFYLVDNRSTEQTP